MAKNTYKLLENSFLSIIWANLGVGLILYKCQEWMEFCPAYGAYFLECQIQNKSTCLADMNESSPSTY